MSRLLRGRAMMAAGDDAFDIALDTREVLADSILGPLARGALERRLRGLAYDCPIAEQVSNTDQS